MKNAIKLLLMLPMVCLGSMTLKEAYEHIPDIAADQKNVVEVVWNMPQTNIVKYLEVVRTAFRNYPTSESNRTNMLHRLYFYVYMATNNHPTTELKVDWNEQLQFQQLLRILGNVDVYSASLPNQGTPINDYDVITLPEGRIPIDKRWLKEHGLDGHRGEHRSVDVWKEACVPCEPQPYQNQGL